MKDATIEASAQQTRFDPAAVGATAKRELDLKDVTVTIRETGRDLLSHATIKLNAGVRYLLHGQNGTGKSTILKALGKRLIPGIAAELRISYLEQREAEARDTAQDSTSAIDLVIASDIVRKEALRRRLYLQQALDDKVDDQAPTKAVKQLKHQDTLKALELAQREAELRSGARGIKARKILKEQERAVEDSLASLTIADDGADIAAKTEQAINWIVALDAELEAMSADTAAARAEALLFGLGFTSETMRKPLRNLSGGWRMKTQLACALFVPCHLLLLDEPTSFLDFSALLWLQDYLADSLPTGTTLLLVSHDRAFADAVADEVLILRNLQLEPFAGNLSTYYSERIKRQKWMTKMRDAQEKQIARMEKTVVSNIKAAKRTGDDKKLKQAASRQKKLDDRMGLQVSATGGRFKLNRDLGGYHLSKRAEIDIPDDEPLPKLKIPREPPSLRFPGPLISCEGLSFTYKKDKKPVFENVNLSFRLGERIAIVGLNGMGKSTLINCLVGHADGRVDMSRLGEMGGKVERHSGASIGYYSQEAVEALPIDKTALEYISGATEQESRSMLASVGLTGPVVSEAKLTQLSGGQRVRVTLARLLFPATPHVLVLDEVTTHLDADTVQVLAEQLRAYKGTLIMVTHDRWFLKAVMNEDEEDVSSDESDSGTAQLPHTTMTFWVDRGKVKKLDGGVEAFEEKIRRRMAKARKAGV